MLHLKQAQDMWDNIKDIVKNIRDTSKGENPPEMIITWLQMGDKCLFLHDEEWMIGSVRMNLNRIISFLVKWETFNMFWYYLEI